MSKKAIGVTVALILLIAFGLYFFQTRNEPKQEKTTEQTKLGETEYKILYNRSKNQIYTRDDCKYFTLTYYLGGGLVDMEGSDNQVYDGKYYPLSFPGAKINDNFYYTSAKDDPTSEFDQTTIIDWEYEDQSIYSHNFESNKTNEVLSSSDLTFPSDLEVSPDNNYLVYLMSEKTDDKHNMEKNDPIATDSKLITRNLETNEENTALAGYSRQLFDSLDDFSKDGKSIYTIRQEGRSFQFVKIDLATGEVTPLEDINSSYDSSKIDWDKLFPQGGDYNNAYFYLSPKEDTIIAYKNNPAVDRQACAYNYTYNIWLIDLKSGNMEEILTGDQSIVKGAWSPEADRFVFAAADKGGCYPGYIKSSIYSLNPTSGEKDVLVSQKEGKINTLAYHPDGEKIVFGIYSDDYVSYLKTLDISSKEITEIVSTKDTEEEIDEKKPVVLFFADWVKTTK